MPPLPAPPEREPALDEQGMEQPAGVIDHASGAARAPADGAAADAGAQSTEAGEASSESPTRAGDGESSGWSSRIDDAALRKAGFYDLLRSLETTLRLHLQKPAEQSRLSDGGPEEGSTKASSKQQKRKRKKKKGKQAGAGQGGAPQPIGGAGGSDAGAGGSDAEDEVRGSSTGNDQESATGDADADHPADVGGQNHSTPLPEDEMDVSASLLLEANSQSDPASCRPTGDPADIEMMERAVKAAEERLASVRDDDAIGLALFDFIAVRPQHTIQHARH